jgi:hypothetical protein
MQPMTALATTPRRAPMAAPMVASMMDPTVTSRDTVRLPALLTREQVVAELKDRHTASSIYKARLYANAYVNRAFFLGYQFVTCDPFTLQLVNLPNNPGEVREVVNKTQSRMQSLLSLLATSQPKMQPVPATAQTRDRQFAVISSDVLEYIDRVLDDASVVEELDELSLMDGTACARFYVDPKGGAPLTVQGPQGPQTVQTPEIRAAVYGLANFHVFPMQPSTDRNMRGIMYDGWRPVEELRALFPKHADQITTDTSMTVYEEQLQRVEWLMAPSNAYGTARSSLKGQARVYEYLELPSEEHPQGRYLVRVNDVLVGDPTAVNPYVGLFQPEAQPALQLGCIIRRGIRVPGWFYGIGAPEAMRPSQIRLNRLKTDQTANRRAMGVNRIFMETGSLPFPNQLNNMHASVVEYNRQISGGAPQVVPAMALPGIDREIAQAAEDIDDEVGRPPVTMGSNEAQVRSDAHARLLLTAGNNRFTRLFLERANAARRAAIIKLSLAKAVYAPLKMLRIVGEQKGYTLALLSTQNIYADVALVAGTELPKDRDTWNQMLTTLWRDGMLRDNMGRPQQEWFLQQLDLGGRRFESQEQVHIDRAQSENLALERGARVMPAPWENHIIHVEQHERHLAENPTLPPQAAAQIWAHVAATRLALLQQFAPPAGMPVMGNAPAPYPQRPQPTNRQQQGKQQ